MIVTLFTLDTYFTHDRVSCIKVESDSSFSIFDHYSKYFTRIGNGKIILMDKENILSEYDVNEAFFAICNDQCAIYSSLISHKAMTASN